MEVMCGLLYHIYGKYIEQNTDTILYWNQPNLTATGKFYFMCVYICVWTTHEFVTLY